MKKLISLLLSWLLLSALKAHACALSTYYWPVPSGYKEGVVDINSIIKRQASWNSSSGTALNINVPIDNVRTNIKKIISHYKYINYLPELVKDLKLTHFELMSYRVEPILGNSFLTTDGSVEGTTGYLMPNVSIEAAENKWIIVLEYKLTFSRPNGKLHLNHKVEIITLTDGTLLYEYPGMGKCD